MIIAAAALLVLPCIAFNSFIRNLQSPSQLPHLTNLSPLHGTDITKSVFDKLDAVKRVDVGGAGGASTYSSLVNLDKAWDVLKNGGWATTPKQIIFEHSEQTAQLATEHFDVIVCGGTLGIFYAAALQSIGYKVAVVERNKIAGREQEWNISRKELLALVRLGILTMEDIDSITAIEFNPVRVGFKMDTSPETLEQGFEIYVRDILNLGVKPDRLIALTKERFQQQGGVTIEDASINQFDIYSNLAEVSYETAGDKQRLTARLLLDAMGNGSPISRQFRGPKEPDGICIVVGSCASGFDASNNSYSDVIYTDTPITHKASSSLQYFWEAFPSGSGTTDRTTYLFTYMDAKPGRPSIQEILADYWKLLPRYQGKSIDDLSFQRVLYGIFPTYRDSPLQPKAHRILQVGDASGIQSPLSFGGFGSLTRHLKRIVGSLDEALHHDLLNADNMGCINSYQPNLSTCWMFQRAMSVSIDKPNVRHDQVIGTLVNSFTAMEKLGDVVMRPFLQDVLQFVPLLRTLFLAAVQDPLTPFKVVPHVGLLAMADFFFHFSMLGVYTFLASFAAKPVLSLTNSLPLSANSKFNWRRKVEAWKFGSGLDYFDHE
jgi:2-polyprenyl-6-methoxyphenol hydroxylase-like FAD-dependent oxidoreductase